MRMTLDQLLNIYNNNKDNHRQNWKKIQALHNFAKANAETEVWEELECLIRFYRKGFLWNSQQALLDDILAHHKIDYTKWAVKDAWVKQQLINGFKCPRGSNQMEFLFLDLDKKRIEDREKMPFWSKLERYKKLEPRISVC